MAISSYVGSEIVSSTDTFNVWLTRTNSIITDMGSVVVSIGENNVGDVTITGALGANTLFAGTDLRGGDANTSGDLTITSNAILDQDLTASGDILFDGAGANTTISTLNLVVNASNTIFNDHVEFEDDMVIPVGTTAQRGANTAGNFRFNTSTLKFEGYTGATWELYADKADTLATSRTISLSGDVTGSVGFDGSANVSITTTLANTAGTIETVQDIIGSMVDGNTETGITVTYQDIDGTLDFVVDTASIDHDALQNFVENEHINHASVSILAGSGLSGGGTIAATRTLSVDETNVDHDALLNFVANEHVDHSTVSILAGSGLTGGGTIVTNRTLSVNEGAVNHDNLLNFVANEHIDHTSVNLIAGDGLTGGGTIAATRTFTVQAGDGLVANSTGVHIDSTANTTFENLTVNNNLTVSAITANNSLGTSGHVLITNGATAYWGAVADLVADESDTLDSVTDRGATTTNAISVGGITLTANQPTFSLTGAVTGSATFSGSNTSIATSFDTSANVTFESITANTGDITTLTVGSISANSSLGTSGQFLASNGSTTYWADVSEFTGEADTLDTVTDRGASTTNAITVGGLTTSGTATVGNLSIDANNAPTISLVGEVTGSATFDGSNTSITATVDAERIQDVVGAMVTGNTETGITVTYQDVDGTLDFVVDWSAVDTETIQDIVGAMFSGNTESGISAVYQDTDGTIDFDVDDFTITLGGDLSGSTTITNLGNATLTATVVGGSADTLTTARTITLAGEVTGNTTFDGSSNVTITTNLETVNGFTSTGNIILSNADLDGFVTATYASQNVISSTSGSITVNWNEGQNQIQNEPTGAITYSFTNPPGPGHFQLIIDSDGTSTAQAITFPGSVKWMGTPYAGIDNKAAIINFYYDGASTYYAIASYEN